MRFKSATLVAMCACLAIMTGCAPASIPPPVSVTPTPPFSLPASPTPAPCATSESGTGGSTSTTFTSPVFASPLTELPTPSPAEIATREAGMQHANPGAPTTAAGSATVLPPCPTSTPVNANHVTLPVPQALPATPSGG
ncbi:MAG TPA: hypothetical protein VMP08_08815 [Anaerolineae bacterium]|nr:hypothetical protein [Anaerolineae bacterium]